MLKSKGFIGIDLGGLNCYNICSKALKHLNKNKPLNGQKERKKVKTFLRIASFLSLLLGGQFTLTAMSQDLNRVVNGNLRMIEQNHVRGDRANARSNQHYDAYHHQPSYGYRNGGGYGYGYRPRPRIIFVPQYRSYGYYEDNYFYCTDQYGQYNGGRVSISPLEVGVGGAAIGGVVGGWKGVAIGGTAGYFGTKAIQAAVNHKRNKKEQKMAEAMAAQAEAEAQASLEKKFYWNDTESVNTGIFYQDNSGTQYLRVLPGQRVQIFVLPGSDIGVMAEGVVTPSGRTINKEVPYGKGKQRLPANAGWRTFNVKLDQLDW